MMYSGGSIGPGSVIAERSSPPSSGTAGAGAGASFFAGGGDFPTQTVARKGQPDNDADRYPFLGASVVGVSITPKAFLYMQGGKATLLHADCDNTLDRLVQLIPTAMNEIREALDGLRRAPEEEA